MPSVVFDEDAADRFRPPPHPDDRLWRHPSELGSDVASRQDDRAGSVDRLAHLGSRRAEQDLRAHRRPGTMLGLVFLAGGVGAASAVAALAIFGVPGPLADRQGEDEVALDRALSSPEEESLGEATEEALSGETSEGRSLADAQGAVGGLAETQRAVVGLETSVGNGSGVLVNSEAGSVVVVTSADLFEGELGEPATVTLHDGQEVEGSVQGADVLTNVAVLAVPEGDYPTATMADAATRRGGEVALIGRHDDGSIDVVHGTVVSSAWRVERPDLPALNGLLQIGTPGAATRNGAPVVSSDNRVVGIVAGSAGDWHQATPIEVAMKVGEDILRTGSAEHARLGIEGYDVAETTLGEAAHGDAGVYVSQVISGSPASDHLRSGDVIVTLGGVPVADVAALQTALLLHSPGDEVEITYHRDSVGELRSVSVSLDARR